MKTLKITLVFILLIITQNITAQDEAWTDKWFLSIGIDPAIASGSHFLASGDRVGAGKLNYIIQFGRENYQEGKIMPKVGIQFEQFKEIHFINYSAFGGITFSAPRIPGTDRTLGNFWFITAELNFINRAGIEDSMRYNPSAHTDMGLGATLGIRINKPDLWLFKLPFDVESQLNLKDRVDTSTHYTGEPFGMNRLKVSWYVVVVVNF